MRNLFTLLSLLLLIGVARATDPIPSDLKISWGDTVTGVSGGIPNITTIYKTLESTSTVTHINNTITACPSNQVIVLSNGVYSLAGSIHMKDGVVLRGYDTNNPDATVLKFTANDTYGDVNFAGASFNDVCCNTPAHTANWTAHYAKDTTTITLSSVAGLDDSILVLDQANDNNDVEGAGTDGCGYCGRSSGARSQQQAVRVVSIAGNDVTISPGIYMTNWASGNSPGAYWVGLPIQRAGIESLSITNQAGSDHQTTFYNARDCWMKNVFSYNAGGEHVRFYLGHHCEVRHCYFYGTQNAASQSYGVNFYYGWDSLAVDNIFNKVTSPIAMEAGSSGNAVLFNYGTNFYYTVSSTWLIEGFMYHGGHVSYTLMEGNHTPNVYADWIHGSSSHNTTFRNRITGKEPVVTDNTQPQCIQKYSHYFNVVGNILGFSGYHTNYVSHNGNTVSSDNSIYTLGYSGTGHTYPGSGSSAYDTKSEASLLRVMNYDVVTSTNNGIVTGGYAITDLPNSYFYNSKPSWFGDRPWPPFSPTNVTSAAIDPTNIPAGFRFIRGNLTNDPPAGAGGSQTEHKRVKTSSVRGTSRR